MQRFAMLERLHTMLKSVGRLDSGSKILYTIIAFDKYYYPKHKMESNYE